MKKMIIYALLCAAVFSASSCTPKTTTSASTTLSKTTLLTEEIKSPIPFEATSITDEKKVDSKIFDKETNMIAVWKTDCGPCETELKALEKISKDYKDINIFLMAADQDPNLVKEKLKSLNVNLPAYILSKDFLERMRNRITKTPTILILDKNGVEKFKHTGLPDGANTVDDVAEGLRKMIEKNK